MQDFWSFAHATENEPQARALRPRILLCHQEDVGSVPICGDLKQTSLLWALDDSALKMFVRAADIAAKCRGVDSNHLGVINDGVQRTPFSMCGLPCERVRHHKERLGPCAGGSRRRLELRSGAVSFVPLEAVGEVWLMSGGQVSSHLSRSLRDHLDAVEFLL